jgi:hypothetical protein
VARGSGAAYFVRVAVLASVAVVASIWAIVHSYTHPHLPMVVPAPPPADAAAPPGEGEIPAPEIEVAPR